MDGSGHVKTFIQLIQMYLHDMLADLRQSGPRNVGSVTQQWDSICSSPLQLIPPEKLFELSMLGNVEESPFFTPW